MPAPGIQRGWEQWIFPKVEHAAPDDAVKGCNTREATVEGGSMPCFPTEARNLFHEVDQLATGPDGKLQPINFLDQNGKTSRRARQAIRGRNSWILWGGGNEGFWGWLTQHGYGIADFLVLIDSRKREQRFVEAGLINQPGMKSSTRPIIGLYLDQPDGDRVLLQPPARDEDADTGRAAQRPESRLESSFAAFGAGDPFGEALKALASDGVDPLVYGYPSGVVGLRLYPNPDFFGKSPAAGRAREYWRERVMSREPGAYYERNEIHADPKLVRPFRASMTCAFCHISMHPLNPPGNPARPEWANLSSIIGAQYWTPARTFATLRNPSSFIHQFVASQQPGTIDTSLISTDHINNATAFNAIFDVPARLARAMENPPEAQAPASLTLRGVEDEPARTNPRHTPRALIDGADSAGLFGALVRVYLNIGTYYEQWGRLHNPVIGFVPQRPFELATAREKSVYWNASEKYRTAQMTEFFRYRNPVTGEKATAPMKLADTKEGQVLLAPDAADAAQGREVFVQNCVICHSSKQPAGFALDFARDWASRPAPRADEPAKFVLPMDFADWEKFGRSDAYREYLRRIAERARADAFFQDNFLSTDIRVPVTLVGTNSGRAVATNAMRGQVWDNFSSDAYKALPAVGPVRFYNPYKNLPVDQWGNNDEYHPPAGGPGYYRPASLIGVWATGPYLHNNALGLFNRDPSIKGRVAAFDDGIDRLLSMSARRTEPTGLRGDLRGEMRLADPGFIYRTTERSYFDIPAPFIRPLLTGRLGEVAVSFLSCGLWLVLTIVAILFSLAGHQRHVGFVLAGAAVLGGAALRLTGIDTLYPVAWLLPLALLLLAACAWLLQQTRWVPRAFFALLAVGFIGVGLLAAAFVDGRGGPLLFGPIPKGTPVNLIMNLNPDAPRGQLLDAFSGLLRGVLRVRKDSLPDADGSALRAFEEEAGPALVKASKCPDFVLDRGHWFAESLSQDDKRRLKAFLKTL